MKNIILSLFVVTNVSHVKAEEKKSLNFLEQISEDFSAYFQRYGHTSWQTYSLVAGTTLALLPYDDKITSSTKDYLFDKGLMEGNTQQHKIGQVDILGSHPVFAPKTVGGYAWYVGDGLFVGMMTAGFAGYGFFGDDSKSLNVAYEILRAQILVGATVFPTKMLTGREAPSKATVKGGKWQGYPGFKNYVKDQARYYAYPSGHTATATALFTVVMENYVDQTWLKPVSYTLIGGVMVALMGVDSHWPSDYPLALLIGYNAGHAVSHGKLSVEQQEKFKAGKPLWTGVSPMCAEDGCGLQTKWVF